MDNTHELTYDSLSTTAKLFIEKTIVEREIKALENKIQTQNDELDKLKYQLIAIEAFMEEHDDGPT